MLLLRLCCKCLLGGLLLLQLLLNLLNLHIKLLHLHIKLLRLLLRLHGLRILLHQHHLRLLWWNALLLRLLYLWLQGFHGLLKLLLYWR
tara:strand:+ start:427 stop:693 length:267 start_codon:yes stop_codon:yes gene_type:complete